jgi:hypothetical protein
MKTLIHRLGYCLVLLIVVVSCSQPESEEPSSGKSVVVSQTQFDPFISSYETFIEGLSADDKAKLSRYLSSSAKRSGNPNGRVPAKTICNCQPTENHCSAEAENTECCVCWDPKTENGACGVYWGVATCKTEPKPLRDSDKHHLLPESRDQKITIYPDRLKNLVGYIEKNGIGSNNALASIEISKLKTMVKSF